MCLTAASVCTRILRFKTLLFCTFYTQNECEVTAKQNPNLCIQQIPCNSQGPPISCWHPSALLPFLSSSSRKAFISSQQDPPDRSVSPHFEWLQGPQSCTFNMSWQKPWKLEISSNLLDNSRTTALFAAPVSGSENIGSLPQEWSVQSLFGACLFIQVLIWTACLKWGLRCFSLLWYCG